MLFKLDFDGSFVYFIMMYITTVSYQVLINGAPSDLIKSTRGIRQDFPLSPYLFVICVEILSTMLQKVETENLVKGASVCNKALQVSHLLFTDDSIIFCWASIFENMYIQNILCIYGSASG